MKRRIMQILGRPQVVDRFASVDGRFARLVLLDDALRIVQIAVAGRQIQRVGQQEEVLGPIRVGALVIFRFGQVDARR